MGVTYKLRDEVVQFIISQRQSNPLSSCRQLAESASQKFGLLLSKSSVHDVLKESGIITPRGRKPKTKFAIPQEKKMQIQGSLSQVKLLPPMTGPQEDALSGVIASPKGEAISEGTTNFIEIASSLENAPRNDEIKVLFQKQDIEVSPEYEGAGMIFLKAAMWDLGVFPQETDLPKLQETDWNYYLTYSKGIKVVLENNKDFFIDLPLPIERCIREAADGLINNVKPLVVHKVTDEALFKACMDSQAGFKIKNILIVDRNDHVLLELDNIVEFKRTFIKENRAFVESNEKDPLKRAKTIFLAQSIDNNNVMKNILNLKGFDSANKEEKVITLLVNNTFENQAILQEAVEKLNGMYLRDEINRLVRVKIQGS